MGEKRSKGGCCGWFIALVILALVVGAVVYAVKKKTDNDSDKPAPVPGPPGAIEQKYASALKTAMQFFDIQKCNNVFSFFAFYNVVGLLLMSLIGYLCFVSVLFFCLYLLDVLASMTKYAMIIDSYLLGYGWSFMRSIRDHGSSALNSLN